MASLSPRNTYSVAGYESNLADFIAQYEDKKSQIYLDTKNLPTIGIGYLLTQNNWQNDFANSGIDLSQNQIDNFANLLTNIASATARNDKQRYINEYNAKPEAIKLTNDDMQNLFNTIIDIYKNIVKNKVGQAVYDKLDNSDEMIALVSLAYNSGGSLIGNNLVKAIKDGDRVAAWYEIRYGSNAKRSNGLQNRRTKESDMFGLYDSSSKWNTKRK